MWALSSVPYFAQRLGGNHDGCEGFRCAVWRWASVGHVLRQIGDAQIAERGDRVTMFEEAASAGTATLFHIHHNSDEMAYVLSGEVMFKIGDRVGVGGPGTCAFMPRGIAHAWKTTGAETARILFMFTPAEAGKWFEELQRLQRPIASLDDAEVAQLRRRCHFELVGPPPF
jgi:quercetin dioxygenase-like cupin family protein